jgi:hypothetical protein
MIRTREIPSPFQLLRQTQEYVPTNILLDLARTTSYLRPLVAKEHYYLSTEQREEFRQKHGSRED